MDGYGDLFYEDGRTYKGHFRLDLKHGKGIFDLKNGKIYEGTWLDGKLHGLAKFTNAKGREKLGIWDKGEFSQWLNEDSKTESRGTNKNVPASDDSPNFNN